MEAKKKTITFQNKCLLNHIKVFIHFAPMPYLEYSLLSCVLPPSDRFCTAFVFKFPKQKLLTTYSNTRHYWKQNISKCFKTVFLHRVKLSWDKIHTWTLILKIVNTTAHRCNTTVTGRLNTGASAKFFITFNDGFPCSRFFEV